MMDMHPGWQTWRSNRRNRRDSAVGCRLPLVQTLIQTVQRTAHPVARERVDVGGLGLLEELGHIGRRDRVAVQARFDSLEPEGCQHEQPGDERYQQPRHKAEVNTAKISAGSRIVTGPQSGVSDRLSRLIS